mgnify:CR=1 FL=1
MEKKWRTIKKHPSYRVSNYGDVYSSKSNKYLKPSINSSGYFCLRLDNTSYKVHKLVAIAFLNHKSSNQNRDLVIDHIDGDKLNNNLSNLREVSPRENRTNYTNRIKTTSKYTGVCWDKSRRKWIASIKVNGKQKNLGRFKKEKDAYLAYRKAVSIYGK